jgi:hypothetical protein
MGDALAKTYSVIQDPLNGFRWQVRVRTRHPDGTEVTGDAGDPCDTRQEAEHKRSDFEQYDRGWVAQMRWLDKHHTTIEQAEVALASRLATVQDIPYNRGANDATREYIERLKPRHEFDTTIANDMTQHGRSMPANPGRPE